MQEELKLVRQHAEEAMADSQADMRRLSDTLAESEKATGMLLVEKENLTNQVSLLLPSQRLRTVCCT